MQYPTCLFILISFLWILSVQSFRAFFVLFLSLYHSLHKHRCYVVWLSSKDVRKKTFPIFCHHNLPVCFYLPNRWTTNRGRSRRDSKSVTVYQTLNLSVTLEAGSIIFLAALNSTASVREKRGGGTDFPLIYFIISDIESVVFTQSNCAASRLPLWMSKYAPWSA